VPTGPVFTVDPILPKVFGAERSDCGAPSWGRLKRLNASALNSQPIRSVSTKRRATPVSACQIPGPRTRFLGAPPKVPEAGTANAAGLIHCAALRPPAGVSEMPGSRLGRWFEVFPSGTSRPDRVSVTFTGRPVRPPTIELQTNFAATAFSQLMDCISQIAAILLLSNIHALLEYRRSGNVAFDFSYFVGAFQECARVRMGVLHLAFPVFGDFTPVLAKHSKSFNLVDTLAVGVDRIQRNFEPLQRQVERRRQTEITDDRAKLILYEAFVEGELEAPRSLLPDVHRLYFEPEYPEFSPRTIWSLSNAFTSALKKHDPIPQFKATAKLGVFLGNVVG